MRLVKGLGAACRGRGREQDWGSCMYSSCSHGANAFTNPLLCCTSYFPDPITNPSLGCTLFLQTNHTPIYIVPRVALANQPQNPLHCAARCTCRPITSPLYCAARCTYRPITNPLYCAARCTCRPINGSPGEAHHQRHRAGHRSPNQLGLDVPGGLENVDRVRDENGPQGISAVGDDRLHASQVSS